MLGAVGGVGSSPRYRCCLAVLIVWLAACGPSCGPATGRSQAEPVAVQHALEVAALGGAELRMHRFRIALARVRIEIAQLGFQTPLAAALGDADLIVNGGYFAGQGSERRVQGLVYAGGRELAPLDLPLGGGVLVVQRGRGRLEAAGAARSFDGAELALQCNPRLIVAGERMAGLNDRARAARTALCLRDGGATLDAYLTDPRSAQPTLRELADQLLARGCRDALNLDGGPSTAAAFRQADGVVRIGQGVELPYAIRFRRTARPPSGSR
jgi:hypothetical protein